MDKIWNVQKNINFLQQDKVFCAPTEGLSMRETAEQDWVRNSQISRTDRHTEWLPELLFGAKKQMSTTEMKLLKSNVTLIHFFWFSPTLFAADALIEAPSNATNLALPVMGNFLPGGRQRGLINGGNYGNFEPCLDYVGSTFFVQTSHPPGIL